MLGRVRRRRVFEDADDAYGLRGGVLEQCGQQPCAHGCPTALRLPLDGCDCAAATGCLRWLRPSLLAILAIFEVLPSDTLALRRRAIARERL